MNQQKLQQAVSNNVYWCNAVCHAHGNGGELNTSFWLHQGKAPPFYPNLITLNGDANDEHIEIISGLAADGLPSGWAIKDSYAALDLEPHGFINVAEAQWIYRAAELKAPPTDTAGLSFEAVDAADQLIEWESAWRGVPREQVEASPIFPASLLQHRDILFLAVCKDDQIVAGAIANKSDQVVGLSNLFAPSDNYENYWSAIVSAIIDRCPNMPIVGYEAGEDLVAAQAAGFEVLGPLRIWIKR